MFRVWEHRGKLRIPFLGRRERISSMDFLMFNQQLATLLGAGIPVLQSLELLQRTQASAFFREVLAHLLDEVRSGSSLSDAFAGQGGIFSTLYCATLFAGERAGELVAGAAAVYSPPANARGGAAQGQHRLTYPLVLISLAIGLIVVLVTYVIPRFASFYQGFPVGPAASDPGGPQTSRSGSSSNIATSPPPLLVGLVLARAGCAVRRGRSRSIAPAPDSVPGMDLPSVCALAVRALAGDAARRRYAARQRARDRQRDGDQPRHRRTPRVAPRVREGQALWSSLEATKLFPEVSVAMVQIGEATGALEEMLVNVSQFYDETIEVRLARVVTLIEPAVLVIMGGVVSTLLLSVYLPMFTLMQKVH